MIRNMMKLCRLCLMKDGTMSTIFKDERNTTADRIMACVSIELSAGDGLPQQICQKCLHQVNKWYKFRELCKNADVFLRQYLGKVQQNASQAPQAGFISVPPPDVLLLPDLFRVRSHVCGIKDEPSPSEVIKNEESSTSFEDDNLQEYHSTEHYFGSLAEALLENEVSLRERGNLCPSGEKEAGTSSKLHDLESYKCCKGRHPCVVFHSEDKQKIQDAETETFVNEDVLSGTATSENTYNGKLSTVRRNYVMDNETYTCLKCRNTYAMDINVSFHVCVSVGSKSYICNVCGQDFATLKTMRCHAAFHTGKFQCNTCGNYFSSETHLDVHMRKHTGERPHVCDICGKTFMYGNSLTYHLNIHSGENSFMCDVCGHTSFSKGNFERHKASHTKIKPHMCEICGKAFTVNVDLKRHRLTHSSDKNFACDICAKKFKTAAILTNHQRVHTGERPFSCDVCEKKFARNDGLKEHRLTHTGEKRHACSRCGKQFTWSKGLRKHKCDSVSF